LPDISSAQNVDRNSRSVDPFSVFKHIFKVTEGDVSLRHSKTGMFRDGNSGMDCFRSRRQKIPGVTTIRSHICDQDLYHVPLVIPLADSFQK